MGLDITAFAGLEKLDCVFDENGEPIDAATREPLEYSARAYINPDFPGRADSIEHGAIYKARASEGFYSAGYTRYNGWREQLAKLANYPATPYTGYGITTLRHDAGAWATDAGPFWELICFSDCEGVIGPVTSAKLANDFAEYDARAKEIGGSFYEAFQEWRATFEMAADNGMVQFH